MLHSFLALAAVAMGSSQLVAATNFTMILGQPTDKSITVNVRADSAVELYFEYGTTPTVYSSQTKAATAGADPNSNSYFLSQAVLNGLQSDTQYYYRMQYRAAGSTAAFTPGAQYTFQTQRAPGSSFVFCVQGDSHPEREKSMFDPKLYAQTLTAVAAAKPDFYVTNGDDFSVDTLQTPYTTASVTGRYTLQLPYFDLLGRTAALFLGTGNHEETSLSNYNLPTDNANSNQVPVWAQNARNLYYAVPGPNDPITGTFYTGNSAPLQKIGQLRDYYAWTWGDALFVVIDPYWGSPAQVDTGLGGQSSSTPKTSDKWSVTHGDAQYQWLKQTLESSKAKWKFIFAHHVMGTGRGGVEIANQNEWGGVSADGTWGLTKNRPTWPMPIHQLMVANKVSIFFFAHDHVYAHQQLDGVTYQSLPNPADNTYTAFNADAYASGEVVANAGFTKVSVGPAAVKVEYVRQWLPQDEKPPAQVSGLVAHSYAIPAVAAGSPTPIVTKVINAAGGAATAAPNTWLEIDGTNLAPAGSTRTWRGSDFVKGQMPVQLDGVSVSVNGSLAYPSYISPTQINVLTSPDAMSGPVSVRVTVNGVVSSQFTVQAQVTSPSFFAFGGGQYIAATHADGSYLGPATLYPGTTTPAKPGEAIILYANGLGAAGKALNLGSSVQSGTLAKAPTVQIGGAAATVQFAGLISPGLFQLNVAVPPQAPDGDLPIVANINGVNTQTGALLSVHK